MKKDKVSWLSFTIFGFRDMGCYVQALNNNSPRSVSENGRSICMLIYPYFAYQNASENIKWCQTTAEHINPHNPHQTRICTYSRGHEGFEASIESSFPLLDGGHPLFHYLITY